MDSDNDDEKISDSGSLDIEKFRSCNGHSSSSEDDDNNDDDNDDDDGYCKSSESSSNCGRIVTNAFSSSSSGDFSSGKNTNSISSLSSSNNHSTSGIASSFQSIVSPINEATLNIGELKQVLDKLSIDTNKDVAKFKPDLRILFAPNGPARATLNTDLGQIDFIKEHNVKNSAPISDENGFLSERNSRDIPQSNRFLFELSKINVSAVLEKPLFSTELMVVVRIENPRKFFAFSLERLFWINTYQNQLLKLGSNEDVQTSVIIRPGESVKFQFSVKRFDLSKLYKMVVYYGPTAPTFFKEFNLIITTRPIVTMKLEKLDHYFPAPELRELHKCNYKASEKRTLNDREKLLKDKISNYQKAEATTRLSSSNCYTMLKLMLQMEDETDSKRSLTYDQRRQRVTHEWGTRYSLQIKNKRLEAAINEYTRLWITPMSLRLAEWKRIEEMRAGKQEQKLDQSQHLQLDGNAANAKPHAWQGKKQRIYGAIVEIKGSKAYFELDESLAKFTSRTKVEPANETYFIRFMSDRTTITLEHRALEYMQKHEIGRFFFPNADTVVHETNETHPSTFCGDISEWAATDINDEQKSAIKNILRQTSYPYPYILFGPPGTGKTKTLVEAISQIVKQDNPSEFILVCATSNSACDEVAKRLINFGPSDSVFRIFSKSLASDTSMIPRNVLQASNLKTGEHYYPTLAMLYKYKVVVCTLTTAGRLSQGKINPRHFSHVFIDEAGSATESQILIAIAGLCTSPNRIHANIIFAGDPKQLGPLIKSQQAVKMGYGISTLERLTMTSQLYKRNEATQTFNQNYVTQLIRNYRSHACILHVSNELYYDNVLQVSAPKANIDWFINSKLLPSPQFPFIFHSVKGVTMKNGKETSPYNLAEIDVVIDYIHKIIKGQRTIRETDIGIISPYRKQCEEFTERCALVGFAQIQIGSVEVFQGQEKPIIIVSTVRSNMKNIGFLDNIKRLNVLLTRAKCLLIIVGDADTLAKDEHWSFVINYCKDNGSFV